MLISVHIPKTAGTSFRHSLQDHFGEGLLLKYGEKPFNTPVNERNFKAVTAALDHLQNDFDTTSCIHGHFLPFRFLLLSNTRPLNFVTWMRNPVDRLVSDYHHTMNSYGADAPPLQKQIISEKWTLEKYCTCEKLKNVYSQFFWAFPLEYFDFIGITEFYQSDFDYFSASFLNRKVRAYRENVNTAYKRKSMDAGLRKAIESFHAADMKLYERALEMRMARVAESKNEIWQPAAAEGSKLIKKVGFMARFFKSIKN
jgi:hypothetical protein